MNSRNLIIVVIVIVVIFLLGFMFIRGNSHDTKFEVVSNSTMKNGEYFEIVLKDNYKNVLPNQPVEFKILDESGWGNKYSATTDAGGHAGFQLKTLENGNYTVHSNFNGTLFLHKTQSTNHITVNDGIS